MNKNEHFVDSPILEFFEKKEDFRFKCDEFLFQESLVGDGGPKIEFWPSYQVLEANAKCDMLKYDEID